MPHQLSPELYDHIISYLWDDKSALSACALSGGMLTVPCQKRLFARLIVRGPPLEPQKQRLAKATQLYQSGGSSANLRALLTMSPHLADYVNCLQIINVRYGIPPIHNSSSEARETSEDGDYENDSDDVSISSGSTESSIERRPYTTWLLNDTHLPFSLPLFRKLKALVVFYGETWRELSNEICLCILQLLRLPSLVYADLHPFPFDVLTRDISKNLRHINARKLSMSKYIRSFIPDSVIESPIYLESLLIQDLKVALPFLCHDPSCRINTSRLKKLVVCAFMHSTRTHILTWELLQKSAESLEHFRFTPSGTVCCPLDEPSYMQQYYEPIDLSRLTNLKTLAVCLYSSLTVDGSQNDSIWWLVKLLRTGSPIPCLEELTIVVDYIFDKEEVNIEPWHDIATTLLSDRFPSLKILNIWIDHTNKEQASTVADKVYASEYIQKLRSCLQVHMRLFPLIKGLYHFAPDSRWELLASPEEDLEDGELEEVLG